MSSIRKEENGVYYRYWYCLPGCIRHPAGGWQHGKSLKVSDGKTALSLQKELDRQLEEERRYVTLGKPIPKPDVNLTLAQWAELYFQQQNGKKKAYTLETYRYTLDHLMKYLGPERTLKTLDRSDMDRYAAFCLSTLAPHTIASRHAMLRSMFSDAVKRDYLPVNPISWLHKPTLHKTQKTALDRAVLQQAFALIGGEPWVNLMKATYLTGGRISELLGLKRRWVNRKDNLFTFVEPKEGDDKTLHLYPDLQACFDKAERHSLAEYVFTHEGKPINRNVAYKRFVSIGQSLGVHITPHLLRHARITHLLSDGVPLIEVMGIVGHRNLSTTEKYAHTNAKRQKEIAGRLSLSSAMGG